MRSLTRPPYLTPARLRCAAAALATVLGVLALTATARAASVLYIRGGGDGHGVGMSQYGAEGFALHGLDYRAILAHYYQGSSLGRTDPGRIVRVLVATGSASVSGATTISGSPRTRLQAASSYDVTALASGRLQLSTAGGRSVGSFRAPLRVSGPAPLTVPGVATYRGSLSFYPDDGGVQTVD
ncbi:MAG: hypothetical protein ACRDL8_07115, partial [Solirubrobacteraceae bacterium]